jgi:APA family basic amino acid/polyamine antiporter
MGWDQLFAKKPFKALHAESTGEQHLRRVLGPVGLTSLGVGAIIGAGIFVLTGQAAADHAGPAIVLSFVISGIGCAFAGLCYAEMAAMIPIAGSAYTYSYATMGEFLAWIIGWDLILEYSLGAATVSVGWSGYVVSFLYDLGITFPPHLTAATGTQLVEVPGKGWQALTDGLAQTLAEQGIDVTSLPQVTALFNLPAVFIVVLVTALLVIGIRESAMANNLVVILKVSVLVVFIAAGLTYLLSHPGLWSENWSQFIPPQATNADGEPIRGKYGWSGILTGAGVIFFAYIGFDAVSTAAQEARNPQRDMPIGILGSLVVCTVFYIVVASVLTGIVHYTKLSVPDPVAVGINATGYTWLKPIVKIGAIAGLSSVILVMLLAQPRIFFTMSRDGLLPAFASHVHPRFQTPYITTLITGAAVAIVAAIAPIGILGHLVSIGTLLAFVLVCGGVVVLRYTQPDVPRPFRTPAAPLTAALGIFVCLSQMIALPPETWERLIIWMAIGITIYFAYGFWHSKLRAPALAEVDSSTAITAQKPNTF